MSGTDSKMKEISSTIGCESFCTIEENFANKVFNLMRVGL